MALQKGYSIERRPMMLKDYLRDDLSSCSANGFKSFPRKQCCRTVRFLLEIDIKTNNTTKRLLKRRSSSSKPASTTISALQRASVAVINAVKFLPQNRARKGLLPRSLSRKLLKKSFWRKADDDNEECEIKRCKLFREFLEERDPPFDQNTTQSNTTPTTTAITTTSRVSTSTSSDSNSNNNSWAESEFTADISRSSSSNSGNDTVEGKNDLPDNKKVSNKEGVTVGEADSIKRSTNTKDWPNKEEKEQFSPVSVLDCPFEDEEEISSPFQSRLADMEGTKQKLMQKIRRFECLAQLEPMDLEKRIALSELEDELLESPMQPCSMSIYNNDMVDENEEENEAYERARGLHKLIEAKTSLTSFKFKADNLILDFFTERFEEGNANASSVRRRIEMEHDLLKIAEEWINGQPRELILGWEVKDGRNAYVRDMEKNGRWRKLDQEKEEVTLDLELDIFTSLLEDLLLDLF